jgi:hypothetical protein
MFLQDKLGRPGVRLSFTISGQNVLGYTRGGNNLGNVVKWTSIFNLIFVARGYSQIEEISHKRYK